MPNTNTEIQIFLTTPEAMMFREFQQFHNTFALLCSKGVFDIKGGSATIHFDANGNIKNITRSDTLFDDRTEKLSTLAKI